MSRTKTQTRLYYENNKHRAEVVYATFVSRTRRGWDQEEALTTPPTQEKYSGDFLKYLKIAQSNGVEQSLFYNRVHYYGWSYEKASTLKPKKRRTIEKVTVQTEEERLMDRIEVYTKNNMPIPKKYIKKMHELGIQLAS